MAAGQVVAAVADIELPRNEWTDLLTILMNNTHSDSVILKKSSLQTIGYICETIDPNILIAQSNSILTAVAQGAKKEEPKYSTPHYLYTAMKYVTLLSRPCTTP
jgi:importin subunit beta-1